MRFFNKNELNLLPFNYCFFEIKKGFEKQQIISDKKEENKIPNLIECLLYKPICKIKRW